MKIIIYIFIIILLQISSSAAENIAISSDKIYVIDGDTIILDDDIHIRLAGLHVPELNISAGQAAKVFLTKYLTGKRLDCRLSGKKSYDRYLARCYFNKTDIAAIIIKNGHGRDCPRYSNYRYRQFETNHVQNWPLPRYCL